MHLPLIIGQPIDVIVELCCRGYYSCKQWPPYQELRCSSFATLMLTNMVGSCFAKRIPKDDDIAAVLSQVVNTKRMVRLFGSELCPFTSRIWIALQCKGVDVHVVWLTSDNDVRDKKIGIACFHKTRCEFAHPSVWIGRDFWVF